MPLLVDALIGLLLWAAWLNPLTAYLRGLEELEASRAASFAAQQFARPFMADQRKASSVTVDYLGLKDAAGNPIDNNVQFSWPADANGSSVTVTYAPDGAGRLVRTEQDKTCSASSGSGGTVTCATATRARDVAWDLDARARGGGVWFYEGSAGVRYALVLRVAGATRVVAAPRLR